MKEVKTLVLCVDRDNDIGEKVRVKGPIVGWKENLEAAQGLALVDPEDTDLNAMFAAVKIARNINSEVATITGDKDVGIKSDTKLTEQLEKLIKDMNPESVILVTDGAEDEQIIPIIQSRVKISSVQTVVVRQSKELEKAYFTITNFLKEISEDPNLARLLFAIPGVALVLLAIGGKHAISFILGIVGFYLILKGLGYEERVFDRLSGFIDSLSIDKISTLTYLISAIVLIIGLGYGYTDFQRNPVGFDNMGTAMDSISLFVVNTSSIDLILVAIVIAILGRIIDDYSMKKYLEIKRFLTLLALAILIKVGLTSGANFWINEEFGLGNLILWVIIGISIFYIWIKIIEYLFISEIQSIREIVKTLAGLDVYTSDGKHLGKVGKVIIDRAEMSGIKVGRKTIKKDRIISTDKVVVVNLGK